MTQPEEKAVLDAITRRHLVVMIRRAFAELNPGATYLPNWHIEAMAYQLERCFSRECKRLIITLPPRYLKSISASVAFVAWALGNDPTLRLLCVSYGDALASKLSDDTRLVMEAPWYRACFPGTRIRRSTQTLIETDQHGTRLALSPCGPMTGFGADIIIVDDLQKADEALSPTKRDAAFEFYTNTLLSRLNDKANGVIVVIQQRLHEADLVGSLLEQGGTWMHLNLSAIAELAEVIPIGPDKVHERQPGDALHPAFESQDTLKLMRREMGEARFATQYQQRPTLLEGAIVDITKLKYYKCVNGNPPGSFIVQAWDTAYTVSETANWTVCLTVMVWKGNFYIRDVYRVQLTFPAVEAAVYAQARRWRPSVVVLEAVGAGQALVQRLLADHKLPLVYDTPHGDKATRMLAESGALERSEVWLQKSAPWLECFLHELRNFPKGKYDDQVDALSLFLRAARLGFGNMHLHSPPYEE